MSSGFPDPIALAGEQQTLGFGAAIAARAQTGDVIALSGALGAGKTTFARGFIERMNPVPDSDDVVSPTFTLVQVYETDAVSVWHFDLYRLKSPTDVLELGWEEALEGIVLVEWPERLGAFLPARRLNITLEMAGDGRRAIMSGDPSWMSRLKGLSRDVEP